jgi:hypothetical protein
MLVRGQKRSGNGAFWMRRPKAGAVQTGAPDAVPVSRSATSPGGRHLVLPLGLVNIGAAAGQLPQLDDAGCFVFGPEPAAHRGRGGRYAAGAASGRGAVAAS